MALTFASASSQRLSVPATAYTTLTYAAWLNLTSNPAINRAFGMMMADNAQPAGEWSGGWGVNSGGKLEVYCYDGVTKRAVSTASITTGTWTHIVGVVESGVSNRGYINGVADGSLAIGTPYSAWSSGPIWKMAGTASSEWQNFLDGVLAELAVWNVVLSTAEITSLSKGLRPARVRPQSLQFYAPLVREVTDIRKGATITQTGSPTLSPHPRIY